MRYYALKNGGARPLESFCVTNMCQFHEDENEEEANGSPRKEMVSLTIEVLQRPLNTYRKLCLHCDDKTAMVGQE